MWEPIDAGSLWAIIDSDFRFLSFWLRCNNEGGDVAQTILLPLFFTLGGWSLIFQVDTSLIMFCTMFGEKPESEDFSCSRARADW